MKAPSAELREAALLSHFESRMMYRLPQRSVSLHRKKNGKTILRYFEYSNGTTDVDTASSDKTNVNKP